MSSNTKLTEEEVNRQLVRLCSRTPWELERRQWVHEVCQRPQHAVLYQRYLSILTGAKSMRDSEANAQKLIDIARLIVMKEAACVCSVCQLRA